MSFGEYLASFSSVSSVTVSTLQDNLNDKMKPVVSQLKKDLEEQARNGLTSCNIDYIGVYKVLKYDKEMENYIRRWCTKEGIYFVCGGVGSKMWFCWGK